MKSINKSYVEKFYMNGKSSITEVKHRIPALVQNDGEMIGFRFYNQEFMVDGESVVCAGKKYNFSERFYFGKRLTLSEVKEKFGNDPNKQIFIANAETNGNDAFCFTQVGYLIVLEEGDQIYDEYYANQKSYMEQAIKGISGETMSYEDFLIRNYFQENEDVSVKRKV